jgi:putative toxin-antitoxin system antitoxin component (TIGR02293 family)
MATSTTATTTDAVAAPQSAEALLRLQALSTADLRDAVRQGLPFSAFEELTRQLEISPQRCSVILAIPPRTVARRKEARQLNPQESDRLYRLARAAAQAVAVLGSLDKARLWLKTPNRALGCELPLDLLDTEIGARQVDDVLLRLNYGIFS